MKKKLIVIMCALFLFISSVSAQSQSFPVKGIPIDKYHVLDSAYIKCAYRLTFVEDTLNPNNTKYVDIQTLLIGKDMSKYFSQYLLDFNKKTQELRTKGANTFLSNTEKGTSSYEIFKRYVDDKIIVTDCGSRLGSNFQYEDDISDLKWDIRNDTSSILSYSCQRAVTQFRGRTYEAWFTSEIPINNGPWKFGGLPGLILKISDSQQYFVFECIGIENLKNKESIKFYDVKYTKIARKDLDKIYKRFHYDSAVYNKTIGIQSMDIDPITNKCVFLEHTKKLPYNPIELK
jgi:GLPGLI family protein